MIEGMLEAGEKLRWFHYASDAGSYFKQRARSNAGMMFLGAVVFVVMAIAGQNSSDATPWSVWIFAPFVCVVFASMAAFSYFSYQRQRYAYAISDSHIFTSHGSGDFGVRKLPIARIADVYVTSDSTLKFRLTEKIWEPFVSKNWYPLIWENIPDAPTVKELIEQMLDTSGKQVA